MQLREEYYLGGVECDPFSFDMECREQAQQSKAYAGKVKLTNLQTMAKTLSYGQEHGYITVEDTEGKLTEIKELASSSNKELKDIEGRLRQVNEQIHYTGQYLVYKSIVCSNTLGQCIRT